MSTTGKPDCGTEQTTVLSVIQDDIRHVQIRATAALAIAAIFVTQIKLDDLRAMSLEWNWVTVVGIALVVAAGVLYFHYSQRLNQARLAIASDSSQVDTAWKSKFMLSGSASRGNTPLWYYRLGQWCFVGGALVLFAVVAKLIVS